MLSIESFSVVEAKKKKKEKKRKKEMQLGINWMGCDRKLDNNTQMTSDVGRTSPC